MARSLSTEDLLLLVDALADGQWHSGETLAAQMGLTRAGLAKRVERLSEWGLRPEAKQGLGYRLPVPIRRLDAHALQQATPAMALRVAAVVDSTNQQLLQSSSKQDPQALLCEFQSQGRGRRGRQWISPFGANLYLSMAWTYSDWPAQLPALSLAVGVVCARTLSNLGLSSVQLKWPNDLLVAGRKLGGILIEQRGEMGGACRMVIGIGLNVSMQADQGEQIDQEWICLDEAFSSLEKPPVSRQALAEALLPALHNMLAQFPHVGFAPWRTHWPQYDALAGRTVRLSGSDALEGTAQGLDEDGALLVKTVAGTQAVRSGEVSVRAQ